MVKQCLQVEQPIPKLAPGHFIPARFHLEMWYVGELALQILELIQIMGNLCRHHRPPGILLPKSVPGNSIHVRVHQMEIYPAGAQMLMGKQLFPVCPLEELLILRLLPGGILPAVCVLTQA